MLDDEPRAARPKTGLLDIAKLNKENSSPPAVFGCLEQIDDAVETGPLCQGGRDVLEGNLEQRLDDNLSWGESVAAADPHSRALPHPDTASDLTAPNTVTQPFDELHVCCLTFCASAAGDFPVRRALSAGSTRSIKARVSTPPAALVSSQRLLGAIVVSRRTKRRSHGKLPKVVVEVAIREHAPGASAHAAKVRMLRPSAARLVRQKVLQQLVQGG